MQRLLDDTAVFNIFLFYYYLEFRILQNKKSSLADAVTEYKDKKHMNYQQLASHWGVCKTTLYRAAKGNWQRPTKKLSAVAEKVGIKLVSDTQISNCEPLLSTVNEIWDGTAAHATKLARIMRDIHDLTQRHMN